MSDEHNRVSSLPEEPVETEAPAEDSSGSSESVSGTVEDSYDYHSGEYAEPYTGQAGTSTVPAVISSEPPPPPTPPEKAEEEDDDDDEGMLRMSFLDHLEELRHRLVRSLMGLGVAFFACLYFSERIWGIVQEPAAAALHGLGYTGSDATLVFTSPMESFSIIWMKLPLLVSIFVASPWILYQVWAFIAPGLYKKERNLAAPFVICTAGLFILGGLFAYFVAFRFALEFLLGIGRNVNVRPMVTISEYFNTFVNVMLGLAIVFEIPMLIFFLTLLRITSPRFLLANSRYAVLAIVIVAAVITPTPDVYNLMLFSLPMVLLFFVGVFASYLLVLGREGKRFPWRMVAGAIALVAALIGGAVWLAVVRFGFHLSGNWPFLLR